MKSTNTHTYFFREAAALEAVRDAVIQPRAGSPSFVWCAGCSTGDEVYSMSIAAAEVGGRLEILGTDVRPDALDTARAGKYGERNLAQLTAGRRGRWFSPLGEVHPELRTAVEFRPHDVARDGAPRSNARDGLWDVIFCRHVLLYLSEAEVREALAMFSQALAPEGYLILGASEWVSTKILSLLPPGNGLQCTLLRGVTAYARHRTPTDVAPPPEPSPVQQPAWREPSTPTSTPEPTAAGLRRLGDARFNGGNAEQALDAYTRALVCDDLAADLHLRLALCCMKLGRTRQAKDELRRSLFLDQRLWPAALVLGDLLLDEDDVTAQRYFLQAQDMLARHPALDQAAEALEPFLISAPAATAAIRLRLAELAKRGADRE